MSAADHTTPPALRAEYFAREGRLRVLRFHEDDFQHDVLLAVHLDQDVRPNQRTFNQEACEEALRAAGWAVAGPWGRWLSTMAAGVQEIPAEPEAGAEPAAVVADIDNRWNTATDLILAIGDAAEKPATEADAARRLGWLAKELGSQFETLAVSRRQAGAPEHYDEDRLHHATGEAMRDLCAAVRNSSDRAEAALIIATVLKHVEGLVQEYNAWTGAPAVVAAEREANRGGMTRDQVLAYLAGKGRSIQPGTWSAYVARNQAPAAARKLGRTPLWDPSEVAAFAEGAWKASS
jgi:hypothetical protein